MRMWIGILSLLASVTLYANDGPAPGDTITSVGIGEKVASHYLDYTHYRVIGMCFWLVGCPFCHVEPTLEVSEYLPDIAVTVANGAGNNPFLEANKTLDKLGFITGNWLMQKATGFSMSNGNASTRSIGDHLDGIRTKSVDVIGNPSGLVKFPYLSLRLDTTPYMPYYQSDVDIMGRLGLAEKLRPDALLPTHPIGSSITHHWGYEFPRDMTISSPNDYKASVMVALHAADIVTNKNLLHTVHALSDSCGTNCAVTNIVEETHDDHEIVEEVYPFDKHIQLGQDDTTMTGSLGSSDEAAGHGNYVFVFWRRYEGCIQNGGDYLFSTYTVKPTTKR